MCCRPSKRSLGWQSINTKVYLIKETLGDQRMLRSELGLSNDNDVAVFLLQRNKILSDFLASEGHCSISRLVSHLIISIYECNIIYYNWFYRKSLDPETVNHLSASSPEPSQVPFLTSTPFSQRHCHS